MSSTQKHLSIRTLVRNIHPFAFLPRCPPTHCALSLRSRAYEPTFLLSIGIPISSDLWDGAFLEIVVSRTKGGGGVGVHVHGIQMIVIGKDLCRTPNPLFFFFFFFFFGGAYQLTTSLTITTPTPSSFFSSPLSLYTSPPLLIFLKKASHQLLQ